MIGIRYEEYYSKEASFNLYSGIKRNSATLNNQMNWHDDLEIQFFESGEGVVILDGEKYIVDRNTIIVANSNVLHFTSSDTELVYTSLIISPSFCRQMNISTDRITFKPVIKDSNLLKLLNDFNKMARDNNITFKTAKLNSMLLEILILLADGYSCEDDNDKRDNKSFERVKAAIKYIKQNYAEKITLDEISKSVLADKYALTRDFKKFTGHTIIDFLNRFRCEQASVLIKSGYSVFEAADMCGFNSYSFFTKTFKRYMGCLPSKIKNTS